MCSYAADVGNGLMGPVTGSSADGDYNYQPGTIPAAAAHIQHRFPGLDHQLQPSGSGVDLNTAFANQQAAGFPTITPFGPQNAYQNMGFAQPALHLALDPPRPQSGGFSPSGPAMGPSFHPWHGMANINDESGFLSQQ
ncbi:hypothetical protein BT67DRAFT_445298 [Trichocladium antarcticum]|uniref:Uncharacterized protein n=1 Tax=Trichocladium antarcticum TaxID=1450529 RepID=A0AAN6ZAN7_9PEZI|nr:hypothetical protein BT67DRAFT_445298 [Trichocladium antarcticum]